MKKKPTIQDVADLAGVSKATVSKYLNKVPYVSLTTQKKIEEVINEIGFQPSSLARGLVSKKTGLIGLAISDFDNPINMDLMKSIQLEAGKFGYHVVLVSTNDDNRTEEKLPEILGEKYQHLDGILLANAREDGIEQTRLQKLNNIFEHIVLVHRYIPTKEFDYAIIDGYVGARLATEYLIRLGHERIAMIAGPTEIYQFAERIKGFKDTLKEYGLLNEGLVIEVDHQKVEDGYRATEKIMFEENKPTAIFASTDRLALGVMDAARNYSWDIPNDLSVIGFDNISFSRLARVPLTTIDVRIKEIGALSVKMLIDKIEGNRNKPQQKILRPSLVVRESCSEVSLINTGN